MVSPLEPFISANSFVVLDGGLGTELEAQGEDLSDHLWSASLLVSNPSLIRETHLAYYQAGADVVTSASYQASVEGFRRKGIDEGEAKELLLLSVKLAVEARDHFWQEHQQGMFLGKQQEGSGGSQATPHQDDYEAPTRTAESADEESAHPRYLSHCDKDAAAKSTVVEKTDVSPLPPQLSSAGPCRSRSHDPEEPVRNSNFGVDVRLRPLVAASIGCYGAAQADGSEYRGDYGAIVGLRGLKEWYRQRLDVFVGADGVDLFMFETIPCLEEARAVLSLLEDFHPRINAVISVSCKDSQHLRSGESLQDFASLIWQRQAAQGSSSDETIAPPEGLVGVGVNCVSPTCVAGALRFLSAVAQASCHRKGSPSAASSDSNPQSGAGIITPNTGDQNRVVVPGVESVVVKPPAIALVAYPNSGEEWDSVSRKWLPGTGLEGASGSNAVEEFGRLARYEWWAAGGRVIGGCCRTRPAHIAELRKALSAAARDSRNQSS